MNVDDYADYLEGTHPQDGVDEAARPGLDEVRRLLAAEASWADPPAGLADDVVAAVGAARATESRPVAITARRGSRRAWERTPTVAAAAAVVATAATAGAFLAGRDGGPGRQGFALAATDVIPGISGQATVRDTGSGLAITLTVDGLPPAEPGTFYEAWMRGDGGAVPIGTFHARSGDEPVELWSGVDVAGYPVMTVTLQQEGAGPESSGVIVLRGDIPQP